MVYRKRIQSLARTSVAVLVGVIQDLSCLKSS
jgi:hypothetical protein